jgi:HSP20 family molecular chaperone IbpA
MNATQNAVKYVVTPRVDVFENGDEYQIVADLPGVKKGDLSITFTRGELTIEGQHGERLFRRAFTVPDGIDADGIAADLVGGVLTLCLPKAAEVKPRRIQIRSA